MSHTRDAHDVERVHTLVVGGGQAGLSVGYHLQRRGIPFVIVDAHDRVGDAWRTRWDSLRLFTPAWLDGLDGMPFPAPRHHFPTKDEMADYLESYARRFDLPVRTGARIERLGRRDGLFEARSADRRWVADHVVVAMADYQKPAVPSFAGELAPHIVSMHSVDYRRPDQLADGPVLLVGAANSGADIAMDLSSRHQVWMSGPDVGEIPFRPSGLLGRTVGVPLVLRAVYHRLLTVATPMGRAVRPKFMHKAPERVRVKRRDLDGAGVECVPRTTGIENGLPVLEDGRTLEPANVIWCTGFTAGFEWIDLPVFGPDEPRHESGVVPSQPGLYFVGLTFLHAVSSSMIHGVGRDAARIADEIARSGRGAAEPRAAAVPASGG